MSRRAPLLVLLVVVALVNLPLLSALASQDEGPGTGLWVATLLVDLLLAVALMFLQRGGGRRRPDLRAVALGGVEAGPEGPALERVAVETYLVRGQVLDVGADQVVIDLGNRRVVVLLDGHPNPLAAGESAQVRARLA